MFYNARLYFQADYRVNHGDEKQGNWITTEELVNDAPILDEDGEEIIFDHSPPVEGYPQGGVVRGGKPLLSRLGSGTYNSPPMEGWQAKLDGVVTGGGIIAEPRQKYYVNGVNVTILNERIQYLDRNGKLIIASLKDYTQEKVLEHYQSLDDFSINGIRPIENRPSLKN